MERLHECQFQVVRVVVFSPAKSRYGQAGSLASAWSRRSAAYQKENGWAHRNCTRHMGRLKHRDEMGPPHDETANPMQATHSHKRKSQPQMKSAGQRRFL
jgi:hypothetical protein